MGRFPLKIIMLHQSFNVGGAERQGFQLARWLRERGIDIEVWGLNSYGPLAKLCDTFDIPWRLVSWQWNANKYGMLIGMLRLMIELKRAKPDVLLPYTMPLNVVCGLFWGLAGAKVCLWNQRDDGFQRFPKCLEQYAAYKTPHFISNSSHAVDFLVNKIRVPAEKIEIILNGIDLPPVVSGRTEWRNRLGIAPETFVACMVANLHMFKDHETLLRAWRLVNDVIGIPPSVLLVAGYDYGTGAELQALAAELGLKEQMRFLGYVDDISGLLQASDLSIFSSFREGVPNAVIESMSAGLPVVATDIPGVREALGDENVQFFVEPTNAVAMAGAIVRLLRDEGLRRFVGQRNAVRAQSVFSKDQMCERTWKMIAKALANCGHIVPNIYAHPNET